MRASVGFAVVALVVSACASTATPATRASAPSGTAVAAATATAAASAPAATPSATMTVAAPSPVAALETAFGTPVGLVFDSAGNLYVSSCDVTQFDIRRIDRHGMMTIFAGNGAGYSGDGGPATSAQLFCPIGMAFGPDGAMYVVDHGNNRIRRIDAAGIITTIAGSGPTGVDMGSFSGDGGPATEATLQEPWSLAFDSRGNLYIGDRDNYRVRRIDPNGVITTVAGTGTLGFSGDGGRAIDAEICPAGVAIDPAGNLLIADGCNNRVRKVGNDGVISTVIGTGAPAFSGDGHPAAAAAVQPGGFAFDAAGNLLVQDATRVRRVDPAGIISTVFGNGEVGVPADGTTALEAPLPELYGIAVDADGNLYLADGNTGVYRVDTSGIVTRFAGKP